VRHSLKDTFCDFSHGVTTLVGVQASWAAGTWQCIGCPVLTTIMNKEYGASAVPDLSELEFQ